MRFNDLYGPTNPYLASIVLEFGGKRVLVTTTINAATRFQAYAMLSILYGSKSVLRVSEVSRTKFAEHTTVLERATDASTIRTPNATPFSESPATPRVLSPQEQQVKTMGDQAKRLQQQAKQVKARNKLAKAQQQLTKATSQSTNH